MSSDNNLWDSVIKGGLVFDGSGKPGQQLDIAVKDGKRRRLAAKPARSRYDLRVWGMSWAEHLCLGHILSANLPWHQWKSLTSLAAPPPWDEHLSLGHILSVSTLYLQGQWIRFPRQSQASRHSAALPTATNCCFFSILHWPTTLHVLFFQQYETYHHPNRRFFLFFHRFLLLLFLIPECWVCACRELSVRSKLLASFS